MRLVSTAAVPSQDGDSLISGFHFSPVLSRGQVWRHQWVMQEGDQP